MCGIFGSVGAPLAAEVVDRVAASLRHRGPESQGVAQLDGATLVHTRLKIIDLSPAAIQPMPNEDRTIWVTFNGEIYNFQELRRELEGHGHRFRSHSDTEVIVHGYEQWGEAVVERLDGMFAFGLWDGRSRRLLLARDRTGKKPLFFASFGGRFLFASEIKALLAAGVPADVSTSGVTGLLAYGYAPPPGTVYRHVSQLLPAQRLVLSGNRAPEISTYWSLDFDARDGRPPSEAEAAEQIRALLTEAVRKRLIADVPVGAFLSGGLDSTIIVGLMASVSSNVRTFSIGFTGDPRYDETHYARMAAEAFGTEHTEFKLTPSDFGLVEKLVWHHDGPFGDSSAIPTYVVSRLTRSEVTVALSGDGGDELFAGYLRFWAGSMTEKIPAPLRSIAGMVSRIMPRGTGSRSFPARMRRMLAAIDRPLGDRLTFWNSFFAFMLEDIVQPDLLQASETVLGFHRKFFERDVDGSSLAKALKHNFATYLPYDLLVKTDRMSMAHALETRSPFLDTALMEYVAGLPDDYKLRGRTTKYILRKAFVDLMPPAIRTRGKMGFGLPLATWFRNDLLGYIHDLIGGPNARIGEYVRLPTVARLLREHEEKRADHEQQIWLLITMEIWLRNLSRLSQQWDDVPVTAPTLVNALHT